jgi:hypothetical protein
MGADSKKSKNQEKWLKAKFFDIVAGFKQKNSSIEVGPPLERAVKVFEKALEGEAIPAALTIPLGQEDIEAQPISIHFRSSCLGNDQITEIQAEVAKLLVRKLLQLNTTTKAAAQQCGLIRDKVPNEGGYAFLYTGLSPDVEILEIQFSGTGRIFGFFTQSTYNVVCVRTHHIENH